MIVLHGFGPHFGMPDGSPFVVKTMVHLKLAGLKFEHRASGVRGSPTGKVPWIEDGALAIADSTIIRAHIEQREGVDLDAGLAPEERAIAWSLEKMAEEHLYFALIDLRWRDDRNFAAGPARFFDRLPRPLRPVARTLARRRMLASLHAQGTGRLTREQVEREALRDLATIEVLLGTGPFLMGPKPTAVDGFLYGILSSLVVLVFDTELRRSIEASAQLTGYVERMTGFLAQA